MCGIIGVTGRSNAAGLLVDGLKRLEYRGYDSAGVALIDDSHQVVTCKTEGKVARLEEKITASPIVSQIGIAHTRWATHGAPEERNAHPHHCGNIAIVHNGIIENYAELKQQLQRDGATFSSDTDSEVICHWLHHAVEENGMTFERAFKTLPTVLRGAYGVLAIHADEPEVMYVMRHGSPMVLGVSDNAHWVASDTLALQGYADKGVYLKDGDVAVLKPQSFQLYDAHGALQSPVVHAFTLAAQAQDKGEYAHFMLKEMHEQPDVVRTTMAKYYRHARDSFVFDGLNIALSDIHSLTIVACGTSFYAAQVAAYWFEQTAGVSVRIDIASEFRYRQPLLREGGVALFISQSGETADTLAAMRYAKEAGQHCIAMVNVSTSTMAREADSIIQTYAGAEIGVASTKAFTAQLTTLACIVLALAKDTGRMTGDEYARLVNGLGGVADKIEQVLHQAEAYDTLALSLMFARDMLFIGRGTSYPLANEGALKMKEISYIHAEGYAAGELKHGPIALVDDGVPIIVIAPDDELFDKTASNLEETAARKGNIVLLSSAAKISAFKGNVTHSVALPECEPFHAPILYAVPLQLLSYYVALHKGADIDQPRNLAKSVTVE